MLERGHKPLFDEWESALDESLTGEHRIALAWEADRQARKSFSGPVKEFRTYEPIVIELERRRRVLRPIEPLRGRHDPVWQLYSMLSLRSLRRRNSGRRYRDELLLARACIKCRMIHETSHWDIPGVEPAWVLLNHIRSELNALDGGTGAQLTVRTDASRRHDKPTRASSATDFER